MTEGRGGPPRRGRERLIVALDYPSLDAARAGALLVREHAGVLKVGLELFVRCGPAACKIASEVGCELFLDLTLHDIPETVARAVASAAGLGARYLTVHASGGAAMLREAAGAASAAGIELVAVTVLTSLEGADLEAQGIGRTAGQQASELALLAWDAGVRAFVCSPNEAGLLRARLGAAARIITPGIRPAGSALGDQKRVSTPTGAVLAGADLIVVGRPIRDAADPGQAAQAIAAELELAFAARVAGP